MADLTTRVIAEEVITERERQDAKWGEQNHPNGTGPDVAVLDAVGQYSPAFSIYALGGKDLALAATTATDELASEGTVTWRDIFLEEAFEALAEEDLDRLRTELIQVSAVCQGWIGAIDRQRMDELHAERADRRG